MRLLRRILLGLGALVVVAATAAAWYVYGPVPVPDGYRFPRHSLWGSGPAALYEGTLVEVDGCVRTENGMTVAWPPGYRLDVENGELAVWGSGRTVRLGEPVRMGGGYYESEPLPDVLSDAAATGCPMPFFLSTGWAD